MLYIIFHDETAMKIANPSILLDNIFTFNIKTKIFVKIPIKKISYGEFTQFNQTLISIRFNWVQETVGGKTSCWVPASSGDDEVA